MRSKLPDIYIQPGRRCVICTMPFEIGEDFALDMNLFGFLQIILIVLQVTGTNEDHYK